MEYCNTCDLVWRNRDITKCKIDLAIEVNSFLLIRLEKLRESPVCLSNIAC